MKIDKDKIKKNVVPGLNKGINFLEDGAKEIKKGDIPEDFDYAVYIKKMPQNIRIIKENINTIKKWAENVVKNFQEADKKNDNIVNSLNVLANNMYEMSYKACKEAVIKDNNLKRSDSNIFKKGNAFSGNYGGNQGEIGKNNIKLVQDSRMQSIIKQYWPNATEEEMQMLLDKISCTGCGYVAMVNTIFEEYLGQEELFEKTFGFPMYTKDKNGKIDYNYEYLVVDYFCYIWKNNGYGIKQLSGGTVKNKEGTEKIINRVYVETGSTEDTYIPFAMFMEERYGVKATVSLVSVTDVQSKSEVFKNINPSKKILNHNKEPISSLFNINRIPKKQITNSHLVIGVSNFCLYPTNGASEMYVDGGHAMTITDVEENGNLIVSSWGQEYKLYPNTIQGHCRFISVKFDK